MLKVKVKNWKAGLCFIALLFLISVFFSFQAPVFAQGGSWSPMASGTTAFLRAVWGSSPSDVFAVGSGGTILHYDGVSWSPMASGTTDDLYGVWGSSASDVFAVGQSDWSHGTILHYDGVSWSTMTIPINTYNLQGVWGTSSSDVYAVGGSAWVLHYDGVSWSQMSTGTTGGDDFYAIWGTSSSDIFVVGHYWQYTHGVILHYDGASWYRWYDAPFPSVNTIVSVWGSSSSDVFASGLYNTMLHYDGGSWSAMDPGITDTHHIRDMWGTSSSDVFAVGGQRPVTLHYDGVSWSEMTSPATDRLWGVWGFSHSDVFAVGSGGAIYHYSCPQVETATHTGTATLCTGSGTLVNLAAVAESSMPGGGKPNLQFPHGFFEFEITGLTAGETVTLTIELPSAVPVGTQYWKYGPTAAVPTGEWYQIDMDIIGANVITITLQDGGDGDDDLTANGVIVDQGGPGNGPAGGGATGVPVFPTWYIGIVAALGAGVLAYLYRRRVVGRKTSGM